MAKCLKHPEIETDYLCMKDNVYMCQECLKCRNPKIYCKFRSSCLIWFEEKEKKLNNLNNLNGLNNYE